MGKKNGIRKAYFSGTRSKIGGGIRRLFYRRKYRDKLFRRLFNNPKELMDLYNAVNQTDYTDESALEIYTLEDALYLSYKNDVSFIICGVLNLYEQQSTVNPNMPLRGLIYFARQYDAYIARHRHNIYGQRLIKLPYPQYVVLYNGTQKLENDADYMELRLSDAFGRPDAGMGTPSLECIAKVYNINYGRNRELMARCRKLEEYSIFVGKITGYLAQGKAHKYAVDTAIDECIGEGVLEDFLRKHRAEVVGMLFEQFNMKEYLKMERRDSYEEGRLEGLEEGEKIGEKRGEERGEEKLSHLIQLLITASRTDEITKVVSDKKYRNERYNEFGL